MAGKKKIEKESSSWVGEVEKYSRQIWLAGLGAYSKISKDGNKLFDNLVQDGEKAEALVKGEVDKQVDAVKSSAQSAKSRVGEVKDIALGKWSELEEAFDKRLNSAISRLGVPSRNEVKDLHGKVETLTRQIEKLTGISASSVNATTKPKPAKPASKAVVKPAIKASAAAAKPAVSAAKTAVKSTAKAAAKPAAKAVEKVAAKPAVKAAANGKASPKPAAKTAVKAAAAVPEAAAQAAASTPETSAQS